MQLAPAPTICPASGTATLSDHLDLLSADHLPEDGPERTARDFRQKLDSLTERLGHEDVERITPKQIVGWTDDQLHKEDLS